MSAFYFCTLYTCIHLYTLVYKSIQTIQKHTNDTDNDNDIENDNVNENVNDTDNENDNGKII